MQISFDLWFINKQTYTPIEIRIFHFYQLKTIIILIEG